MKNFTRIAALLLSIAIIFGFTGCQLPVTEPTPTTEPTPETPTLEANGTTTQTDLETPLTLEAIEAGQLIVTNPWSTFKYKKNGGEFQTVTATEPDVNNHGMYATIEAAQGDKFEFFADGSENDTAEHPLNFSYRNGSCYVYGNVMSLLDSENFATLKEITTEKAFKELFGNNPRGIINHNEKNLVLPATTLSKACYRAMFFGARISKAPNLPATTLAESCYDNMFSCCQNLTQTPELPAPILVKDCYKYMFYYSPNVNYVKCLATDISAEDCTYAWLGSVADTGTFVRANGVVWSRDENGIPAEWSEETLIPEYSISCSDSLIRLSKSSAMEGEEITISVNHAVSSGVYAFSVTKNNSNEEIQVSGSTKNQHAV
ncbi:MAG: hypothetical protein K5786_09595 [Treponema sp.]|nr:hypothetical protein [Treponema sp.]